MHEGISRETEAAIRRVLQVLTLLPDVLQRLNDSGTVIIPSILAGYLYRLLPRVIDRSVRSAWFALFRREAVQFAERSRRDQECSNTDCFSENPNFSIQSSRRAQLSFLRSYRDSILRLESAQLLIRLRREENGCLVS